MPKTFNEEELRSYSIPLKESFHRAAAECDSIKIDPKIMAGAPCISGTRIPVYCVLRAIAEYGGVSGAANAYRSSINEAQVVDALWFASLAIECPLD